MVDGAGEDNKVHSVNEEKRKRIQHEIWVISVCFFFPPRARNNNNNNNPHHRRQDVYKCSVQKEPCLSFFIAFNKHTQQNIYHV